MGAVPARPAGQGPSIAGDLTGRRDKTKSCRFRAGASGRGYYRARLGHFTASPGDRTVFGGGVHFAHASHLLSCGEWVLHTRSPNS